MKAVAALSYVLMLAQVGLAGCARGSDVPECSDRQLLGAVPARSERDEHRKFAVPTITYPHGLGLDQYAEWGFRLRVRVDATGRVACYNVKTPFDIELPMNEQRRKLLAELPQWRYQPFLRNGQAVDMIVSEQIHEVEAPAAHRPLPEVPMEQMQLSLSRSSCFGACPNYKVEVNGDGRVVYTGKQDVDVVGEHGYRIAPERVVQLFESLRSKDLWSLREQYRAGITDHPTYIVTIRLGEQVHRIEDYAGERVGMPQSVTDFEDEIDELSEAKGFVNLSRGAVDRLEAEKFDFRSQAGADLLARAVSNANGRDNQAILRVIELGAPVVGGQPRTWSLTGEYGSLLEEALIGQRLELIDPLIQRGALETDGAPDQDKIDAAFRAAVMGGRLQPIEKIWSIAGTRPHPLLTFEDVTDDQQRLKKPAPVVLLLRWAAILEGGTWEGFEVTQWLAARGCDIKGRGANGDTLLHTAASAGDARLVRYLLQQGFDASTPGRYGLPALGSARSEDVALLLLEAGTDMSKLKEAGEDLRTLAELQHWSRVIDWLDAH